METAQYWMRKQRKILKIEDAAIACFRLARRGQDRQEAEADPIYLLQAPGMGGHALEESVDRRLPLCSARAASHSYRHQGVAVCMGVCLVPTSHHVCLQFSLFSKGGIYVGIHYRVLRKKPKCTSILDLFFISSLGIHSPTLKKQNAQVYIYKKSTRFVFIFPFCVYTPHQLPYR